MVTVEDDGEEEEDPNYLYERVENTSRDLDSIQFWTCQPLNVNYVVAPITPVALPFIAAQDLPEKMLKPILQSFNPSDSTLSDERNFADFLFGLNSIFSPSSPYRTVLTVICTQ